MSMTNDRRITDPAVIKEDARTMNLDRLWRTVVNKTPKILLLIVVLYALQQNKRLLFDAAAEGEGDLSSASAVAVDTTLTNAFFGQPTILATQDSVMYEVRFAESGGEGQSGRAGELKGYVLVGKREANGRRGMAGPVPVAIFLDASEIIRGVRMLPNRETPHFLELIEQDRLLERWNGRYLQDPLRAVDATAGATHTARAVVDNVNGTLAAFLGKVPVAAVREARPMTDYLGEFAILFILVMALACFISPETTRRIRIPALALAVVVLGIWQEAFLSVALFYRWLIFGTSGMFRIGLVVMALVSVLLPVATSKRFYCSYLCPFGAAQELVGKLGLNRPISKRVLYWARWVKRGLLAAIVVLLLTLPYFDLKDVEPFSVFMLRSASVWTVVLAGGSLLASLVVQRPWCRLLCPTGELMAILRRPLRYPRSAGRNSNRRPRRAGQHAEAKQAAMHREEGEPPEA